MLVIVSYNLLNSWSEQGARLPDELRQHFVPLSSDGNLQGLNTVVKLDAGLFLNIRPHAEIKRTQIRG